MKSHSHFTPCSGARALAAAPGTLRAKAASGGCSERSITNYLNGSRIPPDDTAGRLEAAYGIQRTAWLQAPEVAPSGTMAEAPGAPHAGGIEAVQAQLDRLRQRRERGGLSERSLLDVEKLEAALHRDLDKLRGITGSVHFKEIADRLYSAFENRPWGLSLALAAIDNRPDPVDGMRTDFPALVAAVEAAESALLRACEADAAKRRAS